MFDLAEIADSVGIPEDQLKFVVVLLSSYVFAAVHSVVLRPVLSRSALHALSAILGFSSGVFLFGLSGMVHSAVTSTAVYLVLASSASATLKQRVSFWLPMLYLFVAHIYRAYTDFGGWKMDFTGTQMLLTIKLACLGATMSDKERLRADPTESECMSSYSLQQAQTTEFPSVLEFVSFVYTYLGFVAGPTLELSAYQAFMRRETLPSGRFSRSARVFVEALVCAGVMMGLESAGYTIDLLRSVFFLYESNLVAKFTMTWLCAIALRFKYYFAWKLAEGACLLAGVEDAANCVVLEVELAQNVKAITDAWNLSTDRWLKHYIYERVQYTPYKAWATSATFLTSAIWHGVYPGYYLSFISAAVLTQTERMGRRVVRPHFVDTAAKPLYDLGTFVCHQLVFNAIMMPFPLLLVADAMNFLAALHYIPLIALAVGFTVFSLLGGGRRASSATTKAKKA